jgi:amino acid adenylation domain-containing protein
MLYLLQHLLGESAARYPNRDAVVSGARSISYRDLDVASDKLAAVLMERGLKRGDRVAIYLPKSTEAIVAIQGILKAGGVYVPLDPNAPSSRLSYIIQNCKIFCLFVSAKTAAKLPQVFPKPNPVQFLILTEDLDGNVPLPVSAVRWNEVLARSHRPLPPVQSIESDLAYILYTSGSTGVPKGVMISHRASLAFVDWACKTFQLCPGDRNSSHAPLHFDLSIFDMFATLKAGAAMVLVPDSLSTFPVRLADWISSQKISVWYSVPSILSLLVLRGHLERLAFPNLRTVLFAGEVFPVRYLRDLMAALRQTEFYNLYGPTETNVITYYKVPPLEPDHVKPIPIGRACANTDLFALTEDGQVVSRPDQVGELYARGPILAEGYWGDAEKTAKSFVQNPLQPNFRDCAYKTGDLVTRDEEGNFEFLGRRDDMIKSRGYRIELGEIETVLYTHSNVRNVAAVAIPDELIGNRIAAFVVLNEPGACTAADLQRYCADRIPAYMIPEAVEFRKDLPKTSTGKADRPALIRSLA